MFSQTWYIMKQPAQYAGPIPTEIGHLTAMQKLCVHKNQLTGARDLLAALQADVGVTALALLRRDNSHQHQSAHCHAAPVASKQSFDRYMPVLVPVIKK